MEHIIDIKHITKDYGAKKGVFDLSFYVDKGEAVGFLGPNGAGKTTTIRQLMGFVKPDSGTTNILSMDCFLEADKIQKKVGYLPGEIAFMDDMNGMEFLKFVAGMKNMNDFSRMNELIEFFELDPSGRIEKMSKGMKQKIGIVCAFMDNPDILILDEPTSGLDPLMQNKFVELVLEEKKKGKTILMSSHIFEEVEKTCDRTVIIKNGKIVAIEQMEQLKQNRKKKFEIVFENEKDAQEFAQNYKSANVDCAKVTILVGSHVNEFIQQLSHYSIKDLNVVVQNLEEFFMNFYGEGEGND